MPTWNWDNVEESKGGGGSGPLPIGSYEVKIASAEETTFRSGNEGFTLTLEVVEGEHAGNRSLRDRLVFTERAMPIVKQKLLIAGVSLKGNKNITSAMLEGKRIKVKLKARDDGSEWPDVHFWDFPDTEPKNDLPIEDVAALFDAVMNAGPRSDGDLPDDGDSDIPFAPSYV